MSRLTLIRHSESLGIATLPAGTPEPAWAVGEVLTAIIRTERDVVVVCRAAGIPGDVDVHGPYVAFQIEDVNVVSEPGLLSRLAQRPGVEDIALIPFTTFDSGWLLVTRADADRVQTLWELSGFTVTTPGGTS